MPSRTTQVFLDAKELISIPKGDKGRTLFRYFNVWDEQVKNMISGNGYSLGTPAVFIELQKGKGNQLGLGYTAFPECRIILHVVDACLDGGNNTMEENLGIVVLKDLLISIFLTGNISYLSTLSLLKDEYDYKHANISVHTLEFSGGYIEDKGSVLDPYTGVNFGYLTNPQVNFNFFTYWLSGVHYNSHLISFIAYADENAEIYEDEAGHIYVQTTGGDILYANVVSYQNKLYVCKVSNNDIIFNPDNWEEIFVWESGDSYDSNDFVFFQGDLYMCVVEHTSTVVFDYTKWLKILY